MQKYLVKIYQFWMEPIGLDVEIKVVRVCGFRTAIVDWPGRGRIRITIPWSWILV